MFALHSQCCLRLLRLRHTIDGQFRSKSDGSAVRRLNHANKALYGSVTPKPKAAPTKTQPPPSTPLAPASPSTAGHDLTSEIYWLLQHKSNTPVKRAPAPARTRDAADESPAARKPRKPRKPIVRAADESLLEAMKPAARNKRDKKPTSTAGSATTTKSLPASLTRFRETLCTPPVKNLAALVGGSKALRSEGDDGLRAMRRVPAFRMDGEPFAVDGEPVGWPERLDMKEMPSVGAVLQATMPEASRRALLHWKQLKVAELGEEGFRALQKSHLTAGSQFHAALHTYFETAAAPPPRSALSTIWTSVSAALAHVNPRPELCESPIVHPQLQYKGIVDCVSEVDGQLAVVEWKKSDRPKPTLQATYDAPLQLCAYLGAINADARYRLQVRSGMVVIAYTSGAPAHSFRLTEAAVQQYWGVWLERLHEYWMRRRSGTLPEPI